MVVGSENKRVVAVGGAAAIEMGPSGYLCGRLRGELGEFSL